MPSYNPCRKSSSNIPIIFGVIVLMVCGICTAAYFAIRSSEASKESQANGNTAPKIEPKQNPRSIVKPRESKGTNPDKDSGRAAWVTEVEVDLTTARQRKRVKEPVRGRLMTTAEYQVAQQNVPVMEKWFSSTEPLSVGACLMLVDMPFPAAAVMPETARVLQREAMTELARLEIGLIDVFVNDRPSMRPLLDKAFRDQMRARLPAVERRALHATFAAVTGDGEVWSRLHPFDDLDGKEMKTAIEVAELVKREGLRAISRDERLLILRAGGAAFVERMLVANSLPPIKTDGNPKPVKQDDEVVRLKKIDAEAMEALRNGQLKEGTFMLLDAMKAYQKVTPDDCTAEEALMVAVIYARISVIFGKSLSDDKLRVYVLATQLHSKKGGILTNDFDSWFERIALETSATQKSTVPVGPKVTIPKPTVPAKPEIPIPSEIAVAPMPREYHWEVPLLSGYSSDWKKVGAVDVRVAGLSVTKVPIIDPKECVTGSELPMLVVILEVRMNTPNKKRNLLSWRSSLRINSSSESVIFLPEDKALPLGRLTGGKFHTGIPDRQQIPDDGTAVRDILLFSVPADDAGKLSLRLDAQRCGESGDIWFELPALSWKKK
jgi:hypothetical protein